MSGIRMGFCGGRWAVLAAPVLLTLVLCLPKIWQGDFTVDTGWYAAIALQAYRGIHEAGLAAWWSLQGVAATRPAAALNGESITYFNKPPLAFWLNGLPLAIFGPKLWAARIGSVIAACLCVGVTTWIVSRASGPRVGRSAGIILSLSIPFVGLARSFSLDLWLTFFIVMALTALIAGIDPVKPDGRKPAAAAVAWTGLCLGAALLVKPVVALLVLPVVAGWMAWTGRSRAIAMLLPTAIITAAVAALWHVPMVLRFGDAFWDQYFGREMADRAAGDRTAAVFNAGSGRWWYYLGSIGETYWPWLITLILGLLAFPRRATAEVVHRRAVVTDRDVLKLVVLWTLLWLAALSVFADKRPRYLAPLYPMWAWLSALWLCRPRWGAPAWLQQVWRAVMRWVLPVAVIGAIGVSIAPLRVHKPEDPQWAPMLGWIRQHPAEPLYEGGLTGQRAAKIYLATGRWPRATTDLTGRIMLRPEADSYVLYHARDHFRPGPDEQVVLQSGALTLTRLQRGPWQPEPNTDPGEDGLK